jgi:hypothetical protein
LDFLPLFSLLLSEETEKGSWPDVQKTCRYADISGGGFSPGGGSVASKLCINHIKKANDRFLHLD